MQNAADENAAYAPSSSGDREIFSEVLRVRCKHRKPSGYCKLSSIMPMTYKNHDFLLLQAQTKSFYIDLKENARGVWPTAFRHLPWLNWPQMLLHAPWWYVSLTQQTRFLWALILVLTALARRAVCQGGREGNFAAYGAKHTVTTFTLLTWS